MARFSPATAKATQSEGKAARRTQFDRLYHIAWFAIMPFLIGAILDVAPRLRCVRPAAQIDMAASLGILVLIVKTVVLVLIEYFLWWTTLR